MKKLALLLILVPALGWSAITSDQIVLVSTTTAAIQFTASQMARLAATVAPIIENSNSYSLYFSTNTASLTAAQTADIVNYYENLKTQLQNEMNSLP